MKLQHPGSDAQQQANKLASPPSELGPAIAAFDFDGTLLDGDTLLILHRLARGPLGMAIDGMALIPAALAWKSGSRSTGWFKQSYLRRIIAGVPRNQRHYLLQDQLPQALMEGLRPEAIHRLEDHRRAGHRLVMISASPQQLLQPIADRLGLELIATETSDLLLHSSHHPLRILSANCKGPEKVTRLEAFLGHPPATTRLHAYGDSRGDRELLQAADHPHWRSFTNQDVPYPAAKGLPVVPLLALALLAILSWGLLQLPADQRATLGDALQRLPQWLPAIYGVLAMAFLLRYWRWRLLLGGYGIGRWSGPDATAWFRGFALTATPAKLGELARVQTLHHQLGYPRLPLLQVFVLERVLDVLAVLMWLSLLAPALLAGLIQASRSGTSLKGIASNPHGAALLLALTIGLALALAVLSFLKRSGLRAIGRHWGERMRAWPIRQIMPAFLAAAGVSLLIWACEPLILWLLVRALAPQAISVADAIATYLISGTAGMASSLPGGIGVNEAATVLLLHQQRIPVEIGLTIAILRRLVSPWSVVALAALLGAIQTKGLTIRRSRSSEWG
jgi:HAD superfamily hydrolase (TIGR01490 family)